MEETPEYPCSHCGYDPATDPSQAYVLRPGTILRGKYIIGAPLGQGGFGITYIGWDLSAERKVAIKEYFPSGQVSRNTTISNELLWYTTDQARFAQGGGMESFQKEARKMALVANIPQVVNVLEVFQENATAYIVMDFVEGETLQKRLKKTGPLPWNQAKDIFLPVVNAMVQVHKAGLIHRDLSPDNLMLEPSGSVRILDLGAAKDLNINSGASSMQVAKGGFSPLEQYTQRGGSGTWTDVYALAATMYYTLTGVLPPAAVDRVSGDTLRWDLPQLLALPKNVLEAMQRAMVLLAEKRTQTMAEFAGQLTQAAPDPRPNPTPARKKWLIPVVAAAAVLLVVGRIAAMGGGKKEEAASGSLKNYIFSAVSPHTSDHPNDFDSDKEYTSLVDAGTDAVYTFANGARTELFFDDKDQERCRIFTDQDGHRALIFTAEYDTDGNIAQERFYDGDGTLQRLDVSVYNSDGKYLEQTTYDSSSQVLLRGEWTYDSQGRLLSYSQTNASEKVLYSSASTYDADGIQTATWNDIDGTSGVSTYNADGKLVYSTYYNANGKEESHSEYVYDADGRQIQSFQYDRNNTLTYQTDFTYSGDKLIQRTSYYKGEWNCTRDMLYGPRDILFGNEFTSDYSHDYDEDVKSISGRTFRSFSTDLSDSEYASDGVTYYNWLGDYICNEFYRKDGTLSSKSEYHFDADGIETGHTYTYYSSYDDTYSVTEYDTDNNPISEETRSNTDNALVSWTEYEYAGNARTERRYDADGSLTGWEEALYNDNGDTLWEKTYDAEGSLSYTYEYHYDANGVRTGHTYTYYKSWNNTKIVTEYDADWNKLWEKTYDASGKLIESK